MAELVGGVFKAAEQLCLPGSRLGSDVPVLRCLNHRKPQGQLQYRDKLQLTGAGRCVVASGGSRRTSYRSFDHFLRCT